MAWLRKECLDGTDEGRQRWQQVRSYLDTPPGVAPPRPASAATSPSGKALPVTMTQEQEAQAFAAYVAATGSE